MLEQLKNYQVEFEKAANSIRWEIQFKLKSLTDEYKNIQIGFGASKLNIFSLKLEVERHNYFRNNFNRI